MCLSVHPHHSNTFIVGYDQSFYEGADNFYPVPFYTKEQMMDTGVQATMNAPGFNADHMTCRPPREGDWPDQKTVDKTGGFLELSDAQNSKFEMLYLSLLCVLT